MQIQRRDFLGMVAAAVLPTAASSRAAVANSTTAPSSTLVSLNPDLKPGGQRKKLDKIDAFIETGPLPRLEIQLDPTEMRLLEADTKTPIRAQIRETAPGEPDRFYCDVGLHIKGSFGSRRPLTDKPALTLNFDKFVDGQDFHGLDKIHLNNSVQDASFACENLGGWLFRECGVPSPRVSVARVWLNERDLGVFVLKEGFDRPFFKRYFKDPTGDCFESNFSDITRDLPIHLGGPKLPPLLDPDDFNAVNQREMKLAQQRDKAWARLRELAAACRESDPDERRRLLDRVLDVDRFVTFMACETMVAHWDGYCTARNNYRIYHDPASDRLVFLPHGMDQLFQRPEHSLYGNNSLVPIALTMNNPRGRKQYFDRVAEIRKGAFKTETLLEQLARIEARIRPLIEEVAPAAATTAHATRIVKLRKRIADRCAAVDRQLISEPKPLQFDANGLAALPNWTTNTQDDGGNAVHDWFEDPDKGRVMRVTCTPPEGGTASWRCSVLLGPGTYTFSGRLKTIGVVPKRVVANSLGGRGACLRASGSRTATRYVGDGDWRIVTYTVSVTQPIKEYTFVCELSAGAGQALFDPATMKLQRQQPRPQPVPQPVPQPQEQPLLERLFGGPRPAQPVK